MNEPLNLTGRVTLRVVLPIPDETRAALTEQGIDAPAEIVLNLREGTNRENLRWDQEKDTLGQTDPLGWTAALILRRAEAGTDERVIRELVNDMAPSVMGQFQQAYLTGRLVDPKAISDATVNTMGMLMDRALSALGNGEALPSSVPFTASGLGSEIASPPVS
jgi:hypothetical protein